MPTTISLPAALLQEPAMHHSQLVAPFEANEIARASRRRLAIAHRVRPLLAGMRARLNKLDDQIRDTACQLSAQRRLVAEAGHRPYRAPFPPVLYWTLMVVAVGGELALAKAGFDLLGVAESESLAIAVTIGMLILVSSKTTSRVLRQKLWARGRWAEVGMAIATNGAIAILFWQVAVLRSQVTGLPGTGLANFAIQSMMYLAMVYWSMLQLNPCQYADQALSAMQRLEERLHGARGGLWSQRVRIADEHNQALEQALVQVRTVEETAAARIYEYRDGCSQTREGPLPTWMALPVGPRLFEPLGLGRLVDCHPAEIVQLLSEQGMR